jgi:tetratricopeptide (TPR) repeat protein
VSEAERSVVRLVEIEPANYPQLLDIAREYLKCADVRSAARMLAMCSEQSLNGGHATVLHELANSVLEQDPEQLDAIRILVRYCSWKRDEAAVRDSLILLAEQAGRQNAIEDERFALSHLVVVLPQETKYADRLREINEQYGFEETDVQESLFESPVVEATVTPDDPSDRSFAFVDETLDADLSEAVSGEHYAAEYDFGEIEATVGSSGSEDAAGAGSENSKTGPGVVDRAALLREVDSIRFYIDNGYADLATKAISDLVSEFGEQPEIDELRENLDAYARLETVELEPTPAVPDQPKVESHADVETAKAFVLEDLRAEFGLEESEALDTGDYDTHYHTAVAYQEMGLLEDAIKEFQDAVALVSPHDGSRRFFQCSILLGHCFMSKGMPNLAVTWFQRSLETPDLTDDEKQGIWYELAAAYEAEGDMENAGRFFEQVYAVNIDFRDVGDKIKNITVQH